jgi:hypothetical protein
VGNTIFVHHPHCGGTAYLAWLDSTEQLYKPELHAIRNHASALTWQTLNPSVWDRCDKVGIVRNPYDKMVAIYLSETDEYLAMKKSALYNARYKQYLPDRFPKFTEWLVTSVYSSHHPLDVRRVSQYNFFADTTGTINYPILQFEKDLSSIPAKWHRTGYTNEGTSPSRPHYSTYYDELSKRWVDNFFKKDIETWNYCFETV